MSLVRWQTKQKPENVTRRTLSRSEPTNDNGILSESCQEKGKVQTLVILFLIVSSHLSTCIYLLLTVAMMMTHARLSSMIGTSINF